MASTIGVTTTKENAAHDVRTRVRDRFYVGMSGCLLFIVVGGFAPTFSLRALFQTDALPLYLHVHGAVLTAWFALAFTQTCLVFVGRTQWHRRLGQAALPLALAVIVASIVVLANFVPRHAGKSGDTPVGVLFFGDSAVLIVFAVFVGSAVLARGRPDTHKRLMLLASLSIVGPALGRWARFGFLAFAPPVAFSIGGIALLMAIMIGHDVIAIRRVHPATTYGWMTFWALVLGAIAFSSTKLAEELLATMT